MNPNEEIKQADDEFADAFAELQTPNASAPSAALPATAAADAPASPSAPAQAAAEAAPVGAAPSGTEGNGTAASAPAPAGTAEATSPTAAQPAAAPAEPAAPAADPNIAALAAQVATLSAQLDEARKAPAPAPAPAEAPRPYNDEEQGAVDAYLKDWPEVARGEMLLRRAEYAQVVQHVYNQLVPRLAALEQVSQRTTTRTQYQEIKELVSDYDDVRERTLAWIDQQPDYLKTAYQNVASNGTAKDVADLIGRFKKETGYVAPAASTTAAPAAPAGVSAPAGAAAAPAAAAPAPAAAAAAAALKPVATSRSTPSAAADPNDFDAAFKEFASAG